MSDITFTDNSEQFYPKLKEGRSVTIKVIKSSFHAKSRSRDYS